MSDIPSQRPYLLRALHEWMVDAGLTPQVLVDADAADAVVPESYVEDGKIVFNVSYDATDRLQIGNDRMSFSARFGGVPFQVDVPILAVLAIFARETREGMVFGDQGQMAAPGEAAETDEVEITVPGATDEDPDDEPPGGGKGRPKLRVVK